MLDGSSRQEYAGVDCMEDKRVNFVVMWSTSFKELVRSGE